MCDNIFSTSSQLMVYEKSKLTNRTEMKRRRIIRKCNDLQGIKAKLIRIGTPPPISGRKHETVQTEFFLEELFEKPEQSEIAIQSDYFLDRPVTPSYCTLKMSKDASTQIEPGELFDYDIEVQPILEVLVSKTIEQALIEVLEEEEIAIIRKQQRNFLELRASEKTEQQRLQEKDRRLREEQDRRLIQYETLIKIQQETKERVAAAVFFTGYITELLPTVLEDLKISGFQFDEMKSDVEIEFMPWLMEEVKKELGTIIQSRIILEDLVKKIIQNRAKIYLQLGEEYDISRKLKIKSIENNNEEEEYA